MTIDLKSYKYDELNYRTLQKEVEDNGMVFIHLNKRHAKAYIIYLENSLHMENYKRFGHSNFRSIFHAILSLLMLPWISLFHSKVLEMDTVRILKKLRCTWDVEDDGTYRFTLS